MDLCLDYITYDPKDWTVLQKFFCTLPLAIRLKVTSSWEALRKTIWNLCPETVKICLKWGFQSFQTSWIMKVLKFLQNWIDLLKKIFLTLSVLGNSGYENGVGKKIGAEGLSKLRKETQSSPGFPKTTPNMWPESKPNLPAYRKKSISWIGKSLNG